MRKLSIIIAITVLTIFYGCSSDTVEPAIQAPSSLSYSPNSINITEGDAGISATPTINGDNPITFSLVSSPDPAISIDANTGVISSTTSLAEGTYQVSVKATNEGGEQTFSNIFTIQVDQPNTAPSSLAYSSSSVTIRKHETKSVTATASGTAPLSFSITNAGSLPSEISINSSTGEISFAKDIAHGSYDISVKVSNSFGEQTFSSAVSLTSEAVVFEGNAGMKALVQSNCSPCHTGGSQPNFTVYATAQNNINTIISRVESGSMPQGGPKLSQDKIDLIKQWLADGTLEN